MSVKITTRPRHKQHHQPNPKGSVGLNKGKASAKNLGTPSKRKPKGMVSGSAKSLEKTLHRFHHAAEEELKEIITPMPSRANNKTHRLTEEQREARLVLMHRLLIRKVPVLEIRNMLNISNGMYYKLRDQLNARMRLDISKVDVPLLLGDTLSFYDEIRSMALSMSSAKGVADQNKISAMNAAMRAEQDKNQFLVSCGVYSAPVVEHIIRGMVATGHFSGEQIEQAEKTEAHALLQNLAQSFMAHAPKSAANCIDAEIISEDAHDAGL